MHLGWIWLVLSLAGIGFVINAYHPARQVPFAGFSFIAGFTTAEVAPFNIFWLVVTSVVFIELGALHSAPGQWALAGSVVSAIGLVGLSIQGVRSNGQLRQALADLPDVEQLPIDGHQVPALPMGGNDTMWRLPRTLYPHARPSRLIKTFHNIDYAGTGRHRNHLDIVVNAKQPPLCAPVIMYIHGGAWVIGDKSQQGLPLVGELARRGWVTVSINYRRGLRATWPEHCVDAKKALSWVHQHIAEFGGDPSFVVVAGGSAGGHLAALLALTPNDPALQPGFEDGDTSVQACVPIYGVYDLTGGGEATRTNRIMRDWFLAPLVMRRRYKDAPEVYRSASPTHLVREDAPPFFVVHGVNDTLVPVSEARRFVRELRAASSSPVYYAELSGTQHGFDVLPSPRCAHTVAAIVRFVETVRSQRQATPSVPAASAATASAPTPTETVAAAKAQSGRPLPTQFEPVGSSALPTSR